MTLLFLFPGTSGRQPRWEHCVDMTSEWLGMAVGAMYVNQNLPDEDRQQVDQPEICVKSNKKLQFYI